jgi:hypothetical protein
MNVSYVLCADGKVHFTNVKEGVMVKNVSK